MKSFLLTIILPFFLFGCNSNKTVSPLQSQISHWTLDGKNIKAYVTIFKDNDQGLGADDNNGNLIYIYFSSVRKPAIGGEYEVIDYFSSPTNSKQCSFFIQNSYNKTVFVTEKVNNKKVTLTILKNGKLKVVFNGIPTVSFFDNSTAIVSGTLIED